jgi:hypothetical protein
MVALDEPAPPSLARCFSRRFTHVIVLRMHVGKLMPHITANVIEHLFEKRVVCKTNLLLALFSYTADFFFPLSA